MPPRTLPGLGLRAYWDLGEDGWNDEHDEDTRKLSVLAMPIVISRTTTLPGSPTDGDIYIVPSGAGSNANEIALRDNGGWWYLVPEEGWTAYVEDSNENVQYTGSAWTGMRGQAWSATVAASDETTALTTGDGKLTFYMDTAVTMTEIFTAISTQSTSGLVTIDVRKNGTTVFSTPPSIDANEDTSLTGTAAVLSATAFAKGDKIVIDIDAAGTGAKGLKVTMIGTRS